MAPKAGPSSIEFQTAEPREPTPTTPLTESRFMFLILLTYKKPLAEVDRFVAEHRAFLERHYASGHFLLSGRKEPRTGGVILATAARRCDIEDIVRRDPFHREEIGRASCRERV